MVWGCGKPLEGNGRAFKLIKMVGCQKLGRRVGRWVVGVLAFQGIFMIGGWEKWSLCFGSFNLWLAPSDPFPWSFIWRSWTPMRVRMLWNVIFALFGVHWVLHSSMKGNLLGWHGSFVGKRREKAWKAAHLCLMWTLWKERNVRAFNDVERGWLSSHFAA
ncbi:hypothetical protein CK203_072835 [Vitis vinifera]|uniref:Reverse transcriptase zinc-binding domain-containing protein n=1 Tax=Vitis vinifera TaxID=29760 RepID=A0A438DMD3_VITVI|nr:hypothetical protein CK203_072835 [Vitis vinifera]